MLNSSNFSANRQPNKPIFWTKDKFLRVATLLIHEGKRMVKQKLRETKWNNFTLPELKEILQHTQALEDLGIAQDQQMMASIENDIALLEEKKRQKSTRNKTARTKTEDYPLTVQASAM
jgi:hypothetical protein